MPGEQTDLQKGSDHHNSLEFVTKACSAYAVMIGIGLVVMRYGHQNLQSFTNLIQAISPENFGALSAFLGANSWLIIGLLGGIVMLAFNGLCDDWLAPEDLTSQDNSPEYSNENSPKTRHQASSKTPELDDSDAMPNLALGRIVSRLSYPQIFLMALFAAVGEEILFRGAIQPFLGLFLASCLYAVIHLGPGWALTPWNLMGFFKGLLLGWLFQATGSLWVCIVAQLTYNLWTMVALKRGHLNKCPQHPLPQSTQIERRP